MPAFAEREWVALAVMAIEGEASRSADTHLIRVDHPQLQTVRLYLKDESAHPTGSLKHRLARSLFLYGLCNGWIKPGRPVIEASSGSTAISEAYFAKLISVPFIAVVPEATAPAKIEAIKQHGGRVHRVACSSQLDAESRRLAQDIGGCFLDQFKHAERATDWRGNNNIAESIFAQMAHEPYPVPAWVVAGVGTGGTASTIGRYVRYVPALAATQVCAVDPVGSAYFAGFRDGNPDATGVTSSVIEGIGRPRVEQSFIASTIDRMMAIPDAAALAGVAWLAKVLGRKCGPSTGANIVAALRLTSEMRRRDLTGSIVTLICDVGERYTTIDSEDCAFWHRAFLDFDHSGQFAGDVADHQMPATSA
jgi:cysteine synthase